MVTLVLVLVVISLLILVHEWGHFYSARKLGVKVEEFGFGFPPKVYSRIKNGVRYSFNLLPFGGFVKIFGEHGEGEGDKQSFISRPPWQRFTILVAGVAMNFILAWVFFSVGSAIGVPQMLDEKRDGIPVSIISVLPGSPAEQAGLKFGDQILEMRSPDVSLRIETEKDVRDFVDAYRGEEITLVVKRSKDVIEVKATPRAHIAEGEGPLGIGLARIIVKRAPWYLAPLEGAKTLVRSVSAIILGLYTVVRELLVRGGAPIAVSGPVGIFFFAQDTRALGISYFLQFVGLLSVNLAILNFLPIPALDGGRALFLIIEKIRGRRINVNIENFIHTLGFAFLILIMVLVTYRDIVRIL
ncbi:MAG: RIP metalloprotease RseP [Candidatus Sungiibacteriota bacterium]|uniref:Zinc metalloprotease n=1 Tax=Candidatus Sungiibacteriota bacterium TaxID=2750080 RepID=A0A7T5RJ95_9BACT|nr:MAG: RIP metalloprotease RseP [Candidatus Sungbacteria bacterium]